MRETQLVNLVVSTVIILALCRVLITLSPSPGLNRWTTNVLRRAATTVLRVVVTAAAIVWRWCHAWTQQFFARLARRIFNRLRR